MNILQTLKTRLQQQTDILCADALNDVLSNKNAVTGKTWKKVEEDKTIQRCGLESLGLMNLMTLERAWTAYETRPHYTTPPTQEQDIQAQRVLVHLQKLHLSCLFVHTGDEERLFNSRPKLPDRADPHRLSSAQILY